MSLARLSVRARTRAPARSPSRHALQRDGSFLREPFRRRVAHVRVEACRAVRQHSAAEFLIMKLICA